MEEYKLPWTGNAPVRFTGELLTQGSSKAEGGPRSRSWHTVEIYRSRGGSWIGHVCFTCGRLTGEPEQHTVLVDATQTGLRQQLLGYEYAQSGSYKCALSRALNDDERFVEEVEPQLGRRVGGISATILIVDDQPLNRKLASQVLAFEGYRVLQAAHAEGAQAVLAQARPDLILLDLALPGMDGLTLTRKLKAEPATQSIPIVAMTAFAMKGDEEKAVAAGCDGYLTKPIDTRKLAGQVAGWVKLAGLKATPRP
jgi:CheY-like chemotaxis protein